MATSCSRVAPALGRLFTMKSILTSFRQPFLMGRTFPQQIRDNPYIRSGLARLGSA